MKERPHRALATRLTELIQQQLDDDSTASGTVADRPYFGGRAAAEVMPYVETAVDIASGALIIHDGDLDCAHLFVENRGPTPQCPHCGGWFQAPM